MGSFGLLLIILAVLVVSVIAAYNGLVKLRVQAENAWADVDVQLKSEEAEIAEGPVQHAHGEQCKQHRPQVAPEDR